jgi:hypothetical protein
MASVLRAITVGGAATLLWSASTQAQFALQRPRESRPLTNERREGVFTLLPGPFATKETSLGLGVLSSYSFYMPGQATTRWPSQVGLSGAYTIRNQFSLVSLPRIYLNGDTWVFSGDYRYRLFPNRFYGIGNELPGSYERYTERSVTFSNEVQRKIAPRFWLGLLHAVRDHRIGDRGAMRGPSGAAVDRPPLLDDTVPGSDGSFVHGAGWSLCFDTRDHVRLPLSGGYFYGSFQIFSRALASDFDYLLWTVDLRHFIRPWTDLRHTLGLQAYGEVRSGDPPFDQLGLLGGPYQMRGYYLGRDRDLHYLTAQAEYRFPIWWRVGAATFASLGETFGNDRFDLLALRWSAGGGLRLLFGRDVVVRIEFAGGPGTTAFIFMGQHAF